MAIAEVAGEGGLVQPSFMCRNPDLRGWKRRMAMSNDVSRRRALLLSLGGALGLALPTALIASEEAEAQATETPAAGTTPATGTTTPATGTAGMKRRKTRRKGRHARRKERRTGEPAAPAAPAPAAQPQ